MRLLTIILHSHTRTYTRTGTFLFVIMLYFPLINGQNCAYLLISLQSHSRVWMRIKFYDMTMKWPSNPHGYIYRSDVDTIQHFAWNVLSILHCKFLSIDGYVYVYYSWWWCSCYCWYFFFSMCLFDFLSQGSSSTRVCDPFYIFRFYFNLKDNHYDVYTTQISTLLHVHDNAYNIHIYIQFKIIMKDNDAFFMWFLMFARDVGSHPPQLLLVKVEGSTSPCLPIAISLILMVNIKL